MARRGNRTRRTRHRAGRTGVGPSSTTPEATLHDVLSRIGVGHGGQSMAEAGEPSTIAYEVAPLEPGQAQRLPCGCTLTTGADGRSQFMDAEGHHGVDLFPGGSWFDRATREEFERAAPEASLRFRAAMRLDSEWRPIPGDRSSDRAAGDEAFLDLQEATSPDTRSRDERRAELHAAHAEAEEMIRAGAADLERQRARGGSGRTVVTRYRRRVG